MSVVLEVRFRSQVNMPTGTKGQGRLVERLLIDHPESPHTDHTLSWDATTRMLTVRHKTGQRCLVPVENISCMREAEPEAPKKP